MYNNFYGGRPGESFTIVKRFDGISIPEGTSFRGGYYAGIKQPDSSIIFIVDKSRHLIPKNSATASKQYKWYFLNHNNEEPLKAQDEEGLTVEGITNFISYAEGMVQCFKKGSATLTDVGFGEYVVIDTVSNLASYNDIDNGKIFRRGLDYQNEMGGAEYIGWFGGPQGETPQLHLVTEKELESLAPEKGRYTTINKGLVPGKYTTPEGELKYNDTISYSVLNTKDATGNVQDANIGLTIPYLVTEITGQVEDAYYDETHPNLIDTHFTEEHPFYHNFTLHIPKGKQGAAIKNLRFAIETSLETGDKQYREYNPDTIAQSPLLANERVVLMADQYDYSTSAEGQKQSVVLGVVEWVDKITTSIGEDSNQYLNFIKNDGNIAHSFNFNFVEDIQQLPDSPDIQITYSSHQNPKIIKDALKSVIGMKVENNHAFVQYIGQSDFIDIGEISHIKDVSLAEDGSLSFIYNVPTENKTLDTKIKWVKEISRGLSPNNNFTDELFVEYNDAQGKVSLGNVTPALLRFANKQITREEFEQTPPPPSNYAQAVKDVDGSIEVYVYGQQKDTPAGWYSIGKLDSMVTPDKILIDGKPLTSAIADLNKQIAMLQESVGSKQTSLASNVWAAIESLEQLDKSFNDEWKQFKEQYTNHIKDYTALAQQVQDTSDKVIANENNLIKQAQLINNLIFVQTATSQEIPADSLLVIIPDEKK